MNFTLDPICLTDVELFDDTQYSNLTCAERERLVLDSNSERCNGKYFKFFILRRQGVAVGFMNLCGVSDSVISIAPEIFLKYRRKGYAFEGLQLALNYAKQRGYKIAFAGSIHATNVASCKLHEKLGFEFIKSSYNKRGEEIKIFIKVL